MECDLCTERFHSEKRVPKVLPCGHTACLQCLRRLPGRPDRSCPTCRRDFPGPPEELPTNFTVLQLLMEEVRLNRERPPRMWCSHCSAAATPRCWEDHEVLNTKAALRRHLQGALQQAPGQLEGLLGQCQEEHAMQALTLLTGESWEVTFRDGNRELTGTLRNIQDPLVQAMLLVVATRAALSEKRAVARSAPDPQAEAEVPSRAPCGPRGRPPPAALDPVPTEPRPVREMNVTGVSDWTNAQKKADFLRDAPGVGRLINVQCDKDPDWSLQLLQLAAPTVEQLSAWYPREAHLLAVHAMPRLRRLRVWCDGRSALPLELDALSSPQQAGLQRGLQWLRVYHLPRATTRTLLRAHSDTLEELQLYVGLPGQEAWPHNCSDLHSLLQECRLRALKRLVLRRGSLGLAHNLPACRKQRTEVRRVLPGAAEVLCGRCDRVPQEDF